MITNPSPVVAALLFSAAALLVHPAFAADPPEQAWHAHWIGPVMSDAPQLDLNGASWIWADEPGVDATRTAPQGARFFRRDITLAAGDKVASAVALFAADNHFQLLVNGVEAGRGDDWQKPQLINLASLLRPGVNRFTVRIDNDSQTGEINAAGVIGRIRIEVSGKSQMDVVTDASWQAHADANRAGAWPAAKVLGPVGLAPWTAQHNPGVEVRLEAVGSAESMKRLAAGTLDVAIVASPQPAHADIALRPWRNDPLVALLPADWDAPELVTAQWLSQRRWASFSAPTQMHGLIANWFAQAGYTPRPYLALTYPGALKSLAAASQSVALLPLEEVEDQLHSSEVQIRHLSPTLMRPMAVVHCPLSAANPAVASVLQVLVDFSNQS